MEFNPPPPLFFADTRKCDEVRQRNEMKVSQEERQCFCQGIQLFPSSHFICNYGL